MGTCLINHVPDVTCLLLGVKLSHVHCVDYMEKRLANFTQEDAMLTSQAPSFHFFSISSLLIQRPYQL